MCGRICCGSGLAANILMSLLFFEFVIEGTIGFYLIFDFFDQFVTITTFHGRQGNNIIGGIA